MTPVRVANAIIVLAFLAWAGTFIRASSFVCADGVRRYCLADDAMISMRYAWNLSHGHGLVWNVGERVEGITNLLMTLLMAGFTAVFTKDAAVLGVQIAGGAFALITGLLSWRIAIRAAAGSGVDSAWLRPVLLAATLSYYPLNFWSLMGMETGLLAALVSAALLVAARMHGVARPSIALAVLLGLAFWTRPDAAVFALIIGAYRASGLVWPREGGRPAGWWRALAVEGVVLSGFVAAISLFRLWYYGRLTPNTYLLKMGGFALSDRLPNGLGYVSPFLEAAAALIALAFLAALLDLSRLKLTIVGLVMTATAYQIWVGGDIGRPWRMMSPVMPLFCGLLVVEIALLATRRVAGARGEFPPSLAARSVGLAVVVGLAAGALLQMNSGHVREMLFLEPGVRGELVDANKSNVDTALALREVALPGATVGVSWAGTIPYESELRGVDLLGKCDAHIAALLPDLSGKVSWGGMKSVPGHNKYDLTYSIQQLRPTYIQEYRWGRQNLRDWVAQNYVSVRQRGVLLCLLENSPDVDWRRVSPDRRRGCDESVTSAF